VPARSRAAHPQAAPGQRLCAEIDERVQTFLARPIEGDWPYLWIDATYLKVREAGRIVSVAAIIAIGANTDQWRIVADQLRERFPKIARLMDEAEDDVLAHMSFPKEHRTKIHSTNPLERLNGEIKRRTDVVGIFPNEAAIYRLVGALLLEQSDEWALQRRYMTLETLAEVGDNPNVSLSAVAA
jgi:transposase-like protein